ncbi:hypothetical protein Stok01_02231 [Sulfurisphaera tokodaii]
MRKELLSLVFLTLLLIPVTMVASAYEINNPGAGGYCYYTVYSNDAGYAYNVRE